MFPLTPLKEVAIKWNFSSYVKCLEQEQNQNLFYLTSINNTELQYHKKIQVRKRTQEISRPTSCSK